jgi:membrane dipeptidase
VSTRSPGATVEDDLFTVDLIQDLVFRKRRDGWSLTSPGAHVNVDKLRRGGVDLVLSAIPLEPGKPAKRSLESGLKTMEALVTETGGRVELVNGFQAARAAAKSGKTAMMLLMEGADVFQSQPELLLDLKRRGLAVVGILGGRNNAFADTAVSPRDPGGLTTKGRAFLSTLRDAGIAVDLTHASRRAFWDALVAQSGALMVSHTAARALMDHPRNLNDVQIIALTRYGGIMGLLFNPEFLSPTQGGSMEDVIRHIMHVKAIGAIGALALGTDYGGIRPPRGLDDVSQLPRLRQALGRQGLSGEEVAGLFGENAARFFAELTRSFGAVKHREDQILRPIAIECDVVMGESEGLAAPACNGYLTDSGAAIPPASRHRVRLKDMALNPVTLEIFGESSVPWQVEGQNLEGKILFHRIMQLDDQGSGSISLPYDRNLTRIFFSPTRKSALKEVVVWGRRPDNDEP